MPNTHTSTHNRHTGVTARHPCAAGADRRKNSTRGQPSNGQGLRRVPASPRTASCGVISTGSTSYPPTLHNSRPGTTHSTEWYQQYGVSAKRTGV
eukprot:2251471-Rhodomonas_salina.2